MATEPLLIAIAICRSMFAPYAALDAGPSPSSKSLALDFDKSPPPHFQLLSSLRTWNFSIAALTATILLSNVLAVTLVGLFSVTTGKFHDRIQITDYAFPTLQGNFSTPAANMYFIPDEKFLSARLAASASGLTVWSPGSSPVSSTVSSPRPHLWRVLCHRP